MSNAVGDERLFAAVAGLLTIVNLALFLLFVRQASSYLGNHRLADSIVKFLITTVAISLMGIIAGAIANFMPALGAVMGILAVICVTILFVWLLRLLRSLMQMIDVG